MSGTKLEKHLNDHDSSGNYVSTLARRHNVSVGQISDFPHNGHSMSTSHTTTTLGLSSAMSNEATTPIGNNHTIQSIRSFTSSSSSSNHHYQSMEDARLSFEGGNKIKIKTYEQGKPTYDPQCLHPYQNHYEQPITNSGILMNAAQTLNNGAKINNSSFHVCNTSRQQTMPYLTSSSQLLPEHLRNNPDNMQHSVLTTASDVRNQNRIKNMKMHPRTNDSNNDNTRTRWRWLLSRLRKSSTNSQSSSGTSSTSTSLSSATHSHPTAYAPGPLQHNKNHYNNQVNNDLFMYHQRETTGAVNSIGGQFRNTTDRTRQFDKDISKFASTLKDPVNLQIPSNFPQQFILNGAKIHYDNQIDKYPSVRTSKSIETGLKAETNRRSRYHSNRNYHKSQELSYNGDSTIMYPTNHPSPLNGLNRVQERVFDDNGMYDYSHDVKLNQEQEIDHQNIWLQKSLQNHHHETGLDNYNILPVPYQYDFQQPKTIQKYSDQNIERSGLSNSSESSSELRNEVTMKEEYDFVPDPKDTCFASKSKSSAKNIQDQVCCIKE